MQADHVVVKVQLKFFWLLLIAQGRLSMLFVVSPNPAFERDAYRRPSILRWAQA